MKNYRSHFFRIISFAAALLILGGCGNKIEYPEGADTLPTYSDTGSVLTVYATSERTTPFENTVTTAETSVSETVTTVPDTSSETDTETETVPSEIETNSETRNSLALEDVPDVGISEYYEKTQTSPSLPSVTASPTQTSLQLSTASSSAEITVSETVPQVSTTVNESIFTLPESTAVKDRLDDSDINILLTDGRKSKYTGRDIISHPYSYYALDRKHQDLYDRLVTAMLDCEDSITFSADEKISLDDLFDVYQLIYNEEYRLFYITSTIKYNKHFNSDYIRNMTFTYKVPKNEIVSMQREVDTETDKILSMITPDMNDYEIVKLLHDYIIKNCTYNNESENPNTIYGTLVQKNSLCQGYSQSFTYLCSLVGIDSLIVTGVANEPHMWNIVKMDNDYYHIDLTWDDPDRASTPDYVRYDYFGLTDNRIRELRQVDDYNYEIPKANGTKYQYYYYNNLVAASVSEAKKLIISEALKASEAKASTIQILCSDDDVFKDVNDLFFGNTADNAIGILESVKKDAKNLFNTESLHHQENSKTRTIKIFLDYLD
ncbi:MAG: hypothetical protein J6K92_06265 [Oscillospiraceae bacterium]|nr:hypothetical protein [Oscillospiraceae bacterium]